MLNHLEERERLLKIWNDHIRKFSGKTVVAKCRSAIGSTTIKEGDELVVSSVVMYWGSTPAFEFEGLEGKLWSPRKFNLKEE